MYENVKPMTVAQVKEIVRRASRRGKLICKGALNKGCRKRLSIHDLKGFNYKHSGGIRIIFNDKYTAIVWPYLHCPTCQTKTSLWILGIGGLQ